MVAGLDRFKSHFANYADQYILIGGTACTVAMENVGQQFRATKDLDIVLSVEALNAGFVNAFWRFVDEGGYASQEKSAGGRQFYRFHKPTNTAYPFMLELFSRAPDALTLAKGSHLTPIPMDEQTSSLSAILMDDDYYDFLQSGKRVVDGLPIVGAEHLIPLKARAWIDLSERKQSGEQVRGTDIKKHKNDVFRLLAIVDPELIGRVPDVVKEDLKTFLNKVTDDVVDLKSLGLGSRTFDSVLSELRNLYGLK